MLVGPRATLPLKAVVKGLFQASLPAPGSLKRSLVWRWLSSPCIASHVPSSVHVCLCVQISSFDRDTGHLGLGTTPVTLFLLDYFCTNTISIFGHISKYSGLGLQRIWVLGEETGLNPQQSYSQYVALETYALVQGLKFEEAVCTEIKN